MPSTHSDPFVVASPEDAQRIARGWRREGTIAFVPTMGALHDGHLALVRHARSLADRVIVSIFVNPLQFGPAEDFDRYPRTLEADLEKLCPLGTDLVFTPAAKALYGSGYSTRVFVAELGDQLCGASRPGHFDGVTTVCMKLFHVTSPDVAVFGEKDFQQVRIIEKMVADTNLDLRIVRHPTVREPDGLAMSSRNRYLAPDEREAAATIPRALAAVRELNRAEPEARVSRALAAARDALSPALTVDYLAIASENDLVPAADTRELTAIPSPHFFLAVKIGATRLIDNVALHGEG